MAAIKVTVAGQENATFSVSTVKIGTSVRLFGGRLELPLWANSNTCSVEKALTTYARGPEPFQKEG